MMLNEDNKEFSKFTKENSLLNTTLNINNSSFFQPSIISEKFEVINNFCLEKKFKLNKTETLSRRKRIHKRNYYEYIFIALEGMDMRFLYDKYLLILKIVMNQN